MIKTNKGVMGEEAYLHWNVKGRRRRGREKQQRGFNTLGHKRSSANKH